MENFIEFKNISVIRSERKILDDISLNIKFCENTAILGANGSGKSTLIKLIMRKIYPSWVSNKSIYRLFDKDRWDIWQLRSMLGIVTNELQYEFYNEISGFETVLSGFFSSIGISRNHIISECMLKKSEEVIKFLDVWHLKDRVIPTMSSGEVRRFLIARALVNNPKILLLDEPSNSLDIAAQIKLHNTMRQIAAKGTKIILVTHFVSDIIPEIDRFVFFKNGRIIKDGNRKEIWTSKNLSELFELNLTLKENSDFCEISVT
ncbi:MAG: ATP-binding cassette domain-containing protein [Elusimicrobiota bacterium]|jgi:iron complex transport system ATP-binding protein|nr:ATP-binding cassette domain-containing protein [Elusimicrobiota bacterium]